MITNLAFNDIFIGVKKQLDATATTIDVNVQTVLEYDLRRKQLKLLDLFGTVEYHDSYNPKEQRNFKT